jgi:hypothetical protein
VKNVPNHKCPDIMCAKILALQSREAVASPLEHLTLHHQVRTAVACFEKLARAIQDSQAVDFTVTDVQITIVVASCALSCWRSRAGSQWPAQ